MKQQEIRDAVKRDHPELIREHTAAYRAYHHAIRQRRPKSQLCAAYKRLKEAANARRDAENVLRKQHGMELRPYDLI